MNIHEYQGKEILASTEYASSVVSLLIMQLKLLLLQQLTTETGTSWFVIKAQVHAGGREKVEE
jgi:succinyl-CoA synthetase beta subunit